MSQPIDTRDLAERAKTGDVSRAELADVAARLRGGAGDDAYTLLYILGRAPSYEHEDLMAEYLEFPEDPRLAALAVRILCTHWRRTEKYLPQVRALVQGVAWDEDRQVADAAVSAAGEYLSGARDCVLLAALLGLADATGADLTGRFAVEALARSLGQSHASATFPSGEAGAAWGASIVARAWARFELECTGPT